MLMPSTAFTREGAFKSNIPSGSLGQRLTKDLNCSSPIFYGFSTLIANANLVAVFNTVAKQSFARLAMKNE